MLDERCVRSVLVKFGMGQAKAEVTLCSQEASKAATSGEKTIGHVQPPRQSLVCRAVPVNE